MPVEQYQVTFLDVVDAPEGAECVLWYGEEPTQCEDEEAVYLVVYDQNAAPEGPVRPMNFLACERCFTPPDETPHTMEVPA